MKEYKIKVLFDVEQIITDLKELVQNDYNTTKLNFTFDKEGRVLFKMSYPDGTQYVDDIKNNELIFGKGVLNQEGTYEYEIALYTEDGRLTNHAIKSFEVRSELVNTDELVEVDDRVPVLDNLISEVNTIKQDVADGKYNGKDGADGTDGQDGVTPTIGENGNWFIGDVDTGLPSQGPEGKPGPAGGVTLEEVTAITGDPQKLETESKQLVGAINEVLNNSGGSELPILRIEIASNFSTTTEKSFTDEATILQGEKIINEYVARGTRARELLVNSTNSHISFMGYGDMFHTQQTSYYFGGYVKTDNSTYKKYTLGIIGTWSDNKFTCTKVITYYGSGGSFLDKWNTSIYTPTGNYNPATKKYVDDLVGDISTVLATLTEVSE